MNSAEEIKDPTIQTKEETKTYLSIIQNDPSYNDVYSILLWKDPVKSGVLFGIFNFYFFLITWAEYTVVTLTSYLLLALLIVCLAYSNFIVKKALFLQGMVIQNPFLERFKDDKHHISKETIQKHLETFADLINLTLDYFQNIFYCLNNVESLKFVLYFYIVAFVGFYFSGLSLIYLIVVALFVWPRLYQEKKKEIDFTYQKVQTFVSNNLDQLLSKIPPSVSSRFTFLKPKNN
jgi:hypothetical protein